MKNRKITGAVLCVAFVMNALTGCGNKDDKLANENASSYDYQYSTGSEADFKQIVIENPNVQAPEELVTEAQTPEETVTEAQESESTEADEPEEENLLVGYTAKGYEIRRINGVTYVDGVLIANKTYALPEDYNPGALDSDVLDAFYTMQAAAAEEGLNIYISSGFRSYARQEYLYNRYVSQDGKEEADTYSARPGYSEHQTGLCFDLNTIDESFDNTPESLWLQKHAQEYGFIIRYPKEKQNITGYIYESWHLRYLGTELATKIYNSGLTVEEYYGITSVYAD